MLAAMLSSLSSIYNSAATLFTMDIYRYYRPEASDTESVRAGQLWQILMTLLTLLMLPVVMQANTGFYLYAQDVMNHMMPPLVALFIAGIATTSVNATGAFVGVILGACVGFVRFVTRSIVFLTQGRNVCVVVDEVERRRTSASATSSSEDPRPSPSSLATNGTAQEELESSPLVVDNWWLCENFFWFSAELCLFSFAVMVGVSMMTTSRSSSAGRPSDREAQKLRKYELQEIQDGEIGALGSMSGGATPSSDRGFDSPTSAPPKHISTTSNTIDHDLKDRRSQKERCYGRTMFSVFGDILPGWKQHLVATDENKIKSTDPARLRRSSPLRRTSGRSTTARAFGLASPTRGYASFRDEEDENDESRLDHLDDIEVDVEPGVVRSSTSAPVGRTLELAEIVGKGKQDRPASEPGEKDRFRPLPLSRNNSHEEEQHPEMIDGEFYEKNSHLLHDPFENTSQNLQALALIVIVSGIILHFL
ncbi:unnamed protein product [Amoebophrya sp. A25]|nr:unnamed protein product [Amoebophrya sp. A25]|eukprot:GSA25T00008301001.1